jgi:mono/diheme cytochrome c family protein
MGGALALAVGVVVSCVAGCGSARPPTQVDAQHLGPIGSRDVARGEHIFRTLCAACHRGRVNPAGYHWSAPQMRHQIREGNALMPALPAHRLSDDRVEAVLAYLSTIGAIDGELPPDPDAPVDEIAEDEELAELEGELEEEIEDEIDDTEIDDTEIETAIDDTEIADAEIDDTEIADAEIESEIEEDEPPRERATALADPTMPPGEPQRPPGN